MARKLIVEIIGDASSLDRSLSRANRSLTRFGAQTGHATRSMHGLTTGFHGVRHGVAMLTSGLLGGAGLVYGLHTAFEEMAEVQKVGAQTQAVIESTGGIANVSAKHVEELATSLMNLSGVNDEVITSGENMLLTFTNIRNYAGANNDIFDQATKTVLNLSIALKEDVPQAAKQLGKALQDPVRGITALRRVGVAFTEQQRAQIKSMVESGNLLGAQKLILHELTVEFGNSAKRLGETPIGKLHIFQENLRNLAGVIAGLLTPSLEKFLDSANRWLQNTKNQESVIHTVQSAFEILGGMIRTIAGLFQRFSDIVGGTKRALEILLGVFIAYKTARIVATLAGMATQLGLIATNAEKAAAAGPIGGAGGGAARGAATGAEGAAAGAAGGAAAGGRGRLLWGALRVAGPAIAALTIAELIINTKAYRIVHGKIQEEAHRTLGKNIGDLITGNIIDQAKRAWGAWKDFDEKVIHHSSQSAEKVAKSWGAVYNTIERRNVQVARFQADVLTGKAQAPKPLPEPPTPHGPTAATREQWFEARIGRMISRSQYDTLRQQVAITAKVIGLIRQRLAHMKKGETYLKLEDTLLEQIAHLKDLRQQLVQQAVAAFDISIARAGLTTTLSDDIAVLEKENAVLKRLIARHKNNKDLILQQIQVQGEINDLRAQQAEAAKEARQEAARRRRERLETQLFSILGFGPGGAPKIPSLKQLRAQFAGLADDVKDMSPRLRREYDALAKVLQRSFLPPNIRQKVREMMNQILDDLQKGPGGGEPRTRFRHVGTDWVLRGLGLTPDQIEALRGRISARQGGMVPGVQQPAFATQGLAVGAGAGMIITGPITMNGITDISAMEQALLKRQKARPHTRRGAR